MKVIIVLLVPLRMTSIRVSRERTAIKPTSHQLTSVTPVQRANTVNGAQVSEGIALTVKGGDILNMLI